MGVEGLGESGGSDDEIGKLGQGRERGSNGGGGGRREVG